MNTCCGWNNPCDPECHGRSTSTSYMTPQLARFVDFLRSRPAQEIHVTQEKYDQLARDSERELGIHPYALAKAFAGGGFRINGCEIKIIGPEEN